MQHSGIRELRWPALFYTVVTIILAYPLSVRPGELLFGDNPDTHLYMWTLAWNVHALTTQPLSLFDANIYYPNDLTLAYSENLIGLAVMVAPFVWLTQNPTLAINLAALASCVLCGLGAYVLARRLGLGRWSAVICGLIFAFSPARFVRNGQLHVGAVQWIPLTLAFLHIYLDRGRRRDLRLAAAFYSAQAVTSGHGAVFPTLAVTALLAFRVCLGEPVELWKRVRDLGIAGTVLLMPAALIYLPYRRVANEMAFRRGWESWEPSPESFLAAPVHVQRWLMGLLPGPHPFEAANAYLFPGYVALVFALVAIATLFDPGRDESSEADRPAPHDGLPRRYLLGYFVEVLALGAIVIGLTVALGYDIRLRFDGQTWLSARDPLRPLLVAVTLVALRIALSCVVPFRLAGRLRTASGRLRSGLRRVAALRTNPTAFYLVLTLGCIGIILPPPLGLWPHTYWLPGINQIRVPGRFVVMAVLGLAVLAAMGFDRVSSRLSPRRRTWLAAVVSTCIIVEGAGMPIPVSPFHRQDTDVDRWLARQRAPFAIAEFPVRPSPRYQSLYMLHSMAHWQKTVHGYSGYEAPLHTELYRQLRAFPDEVSLTRLRELRVTYAVVHRELYSDEEWRLMESRFETFRDQLELGFSLGSGRVYVVR